MSCNYCGGNHKTQNCPDKEDYEAFDKKSDCPNCNGVGRFPCPTCNGAGVIVVQRRIIVDGQPKLVYDEVSCPETVDCRRCSGTGKLD